MELCEYLEFVKSGEVIKGGSAAHMLMHDYSQRAMMITAELNSVYHTKDEVRALFFSAYRKARG